MSVPHMKSTEVDFATKSYDGCYCDLGPYLLNRSCVPWHSARATTMERRTRSGILCNNW